MGKKFNEFTYEEKEKILELHNDKKLNKEIAELFDTSKTMIGRLLRSMNVESRHPLLTDERKLAIKECYEEYKNLHKVGKIMKCNDKTIVKILQEFGVKQLSGGEVRRKYKIDNYYFENIDNQNKAYCLGIFFSDGTVSKNGNYIGISLQEKDKTLLDKLNMEFGGNRKLSLIEYNKKNKNWQNQYFLSISCKQMHDDLIKHGAVPNKSLILEFPTTVPQDLIRHFVRGYFDGDGSISKKEDRCTLISTESFCNTLADIVKKELDINCSVMFCHNKKDKPTRTFQIAGKNQVKKFLDWLYQDANIYLERKYDLYILKYYPDINNSLSA